MKIGRWVLAILLVVVFMVFALGSGESESESGSGSGNQGSGSAIQKEEASDKLGEYTVVIDSCRIAKDYENDPVVIVKYIFTNVSDDDSASFSLSFDDEVYQNGVGLNKAYVLKDSAKYNADNQTKAIKKGATLEVEVAYELNDTTTDIEVEVKELFSFSDKTLKKTFKIAE